MRRWIQWRVLGDLIKLDGSPIATLYALKRKYGRTGGAMLNKHVNVYLNDHLAGSVAAIDILDALEQVEGHQEWAIRIRSEIVADRQELERLMQNAHVTTGIVRRASAWAAEKIVELKSRLDDGGDGYLHTFELLEALSLGIEGKRALWLALQSVAAQEPVFRVLDYPHLLDRAVQQRSEVEEHRIAAAEKALRSA